MLSLVASCSLFVICSLLFVLCCRCRCSLFLVRCLFTDYCWSLLFGLCCVCLLLVACCSLAVVCCSLCVVVCGSIFVVCCLS